MGDRARREAAVQRIKDKRDLWVHASAYVIGNGAQIAVWAAGGGGYFWPMWSLIGWGVGLAFHAWSVFGNPPITEQEIQREIYRDDG